MIFESLNAKGEKLTPADLIRNFLLMQVHVGDQDRLFSTYWLSVQQALNADLTEFVRHYLMKEGKILREAEVYFELKDRLAGSSPAQAEAFLRDLYRHGMFYARFVGSQTDPDLETAERLDRLRRLKVTVAYPFLLRVFDAFDTGLLNKEQVLQTLDLLESFVIRRAVCNVPTNQLRRMFPPVFDATGGPGPTFVDGLRRQLGGHRCPDDKAFFSALSTDPLYATSEKNTRLRLILERIERSFGHKEPADLSKASIEHVLPQTLTQEWLGELGEDATGKWGQVVHTLGNLTLSAYNAELSNQPFAVKRQALVESHFVLNQHFKGIDQWTDERIRERGRILAQRALQVWPDVGRIPGSLEREKRPDQRPIAVRFRGKEEPCKNWREGFIKLVHWFEESQPGLIARLAADPTLYAVVAADPNRFVRSKIQIGGVYLNTHASAVQLRDWLKRIAERGGINEVGYGFITRDTSWDDGNGPHDREG